MKKQLERLNQRTKVRVEGLTDMLAKLRKFYNELGEVTDQIDSKMVELQSAAATSGADEQALHLKRGQLQVSGHLPAVYSIDQHPCDKYY
jgi:hypothetical protein